MTTPVRTTTTVETNQLIRGNPPTLVLELNNQI
ncbi:unnamed protein product, partial [Adineta steineri]